MKKTFEPITKLAQDSLIIGEITLDSPKNQNVSTVNLNLSLNSINNPSQTAYTIQAAFWQSEENHSPKVFVNISNPFRFYSSSKLQNQISLTDWLFLSEATKLFEVSPNHSSSGQYANQLEEHLKRSKNFEDFYLKVAPIHPKNDSMDCIGLLSNGKENTQTMGALRNQPSQINTQVSPSQKSVGTQSMSVN